METNSLNFSEYVPQVVKDSSKANLSKSETNLLGALCYKSISTRTEWFTITQKELFEQVNISPAQGNRLLDKLVEKGLIERKKGTNGKTTKYKLHPAITDLLEHGTQDGTMDGTMELRDGTQNVSEMEELVINDVVKVGDAEVKTETIDTSIPYDPRAVPKWESDALFEFIEDGTRDLKWNEVKGFQSKIDEYVLNFVDTMFYTAMKNVAKMRLNKIYERKLYRRE